VEGGERRDERLHRPLQVHAKARQLVPDRLEVGEFRRGHGGQSDLVGEGGRHARVRGHPLEGGELAVGQQAEQIHNGVVGCPVGSRR
jgi:hypothetical protein